MNTEMPRPSWDRSRNAVKGIPARVVTIPVAIWRGGQRFLCGPTVVQSVTQRRWVQIEKLGPLGVGKSFAAMRQVIVLARVVGLLLLSGPSDVARLVVAVVIDAVKGMAGRRTSANVAEEGGETLSPFVVHTDAASAVVLEVARTRNVASRPCLLPDAVFRHLRTAVCRYAFQPQTTATRRVSSPQGMRGYLSGVTAIAHARPRDISALICSASAHRQPSESLA